MFAEYLPSAKLTDLVDAYFVIQRAHDSEEETEEIVIPDGTHGLLFIEKGQIRRASIAGVAEQNPLQSICVFGQKSRAVTYHFNGFRRQTKTFRPEHLLRFIRS